MVQVHVFSNWMMHIIKATSWYHPDFTLSPAPWDIAL